ncbi:MAG: hypothetical protein AAGB13_17810 [Cyanobacteria bacterium P01_F01_bin.33]
MKHQVYEGTWEEVVAHAAELSGKQVRVTVLDGTCMADIAHNTRKQAAERGLTDEIFQQLMKSQ